MDALISLVEELHISVTQILELYIDIGIYIYFWWSALLLRDDNTASDNSEVYRCRLYGVKKLRDEGLWNVPTNKLVTPFVDARLIWFWALLVNYY